MIYLTSYVPTDTKRLACGVLVFLSTVSCCITGEIHGFPGKDETKAFEIKLHEIRKKNQPEELTSTAQGRIHAVEHDLLPPARGVQSPTGRGNVPPVRINRRNSPAPVWQVHRLQNRPLETMGGPLHARSLSLARQRVHNAHLQSYESTVWWYLSR